MMTRIRLGGIKIFEGRAYLSSSSEHEGSALTEICARLADNRINLTLLTQLVDSGQGKDAIALVTESADAFTGYFLMKIDKDQGQAVTLVPEVNILSIFPHDQKPGVTGALLQTLINSAVCPLGLASSPSAMSFLVSDADTRKAIDSLFNPFEFPAFPSPLDWHAAYQGREQLLKEVICSFQEEVIKIYNIAHQTDLELWSGVLTWSQLAGLGAALQVLESLRLTLPFLVALNPRDEHLFVAFCLGDDPGHQAQLTLDQCLGAASLTRCSPVAALFLHGPHFGDRYGISSALVGALRTAGIAPLALSCAVSSMSAVIRAADLEAALQALGTRFAIPGAGA
jgi:aspartokinase